MPQLLWHRTRAALTRNRHDYEPALVTTTPTTTAATTRRKHARAQDKPGHPAPAADPKSPAPATGYHQAKCQRQT